MVEAFHSPDILSRTLTLTVRHPAMTVSLSLNVIKEPSQCFSSTSVSSWKFTKSVLKHKLLILHCWPCCILTLPFSAFRRALHSKTKVYSIVTKKTRATPNWKVESLDKIKAPWVNYRNLVLNFFPTK